MLIPAFVMVPLEFLQGKRRADGEASVTAVAIQKQMDNILRVVTANVDKSMALLGKPCQEVIGELTRTSTLSPYFRSLVLVQVFLRLLVLGTAGRFKPGARAGCGTNYQASPANKHDPGSVLLDLKTARPPPGDPGCGVRRSY